MNTCRHLNKKSVLEWWKGGDYYEPMPFPPLVIGKPSDSGMPIEQFITLAAWKVGGYAIYRASIELKIEGQADDTQEAYNTRRLKDGVDKVVVTFWVSVEVVLFGLFQFREVPPKIIGSACFLAKCFVGVIHTKRK
ncbi:hypothetical protein FA13DRAFT_1709384 [Coprinellus micaceus]|uniref:Uncharacterized protein n=1 Tax=Coprinellus micaceus TaxID=71717 RepID=A0A4Y7TCL3_COPMI|nr:hypothetical protein FA13DRAFT_1709384 [Coprinellus micaceus]